MPRSACCRWWPPATAGTSAGCPPRCIPIPASRQCSSTTVTLAAPVSPNAGTPPPSPGWTWCSPPSARGPRQPDRDHPVRHDQLRGAELVRLGDDDARRDTGHDQQPVREPLEQYGRDTCPGDHPSSTAHRRHGGQPDTPDPASQIDVTGPARAFAAAGWNDAASPAPSTSAPTVASSPST